MAKEKRIKVTLVKSVIGSLPTQRRTVKALGLKKIGSSIEHNASSSIMGMINVVSHMVKVEEI